ncbi:MAG: UPF0716 protein FxsA [Pseudorhodobacter sp.]|jgi:UPF0716 protein FxsA
MWLLLAFVAVPLIEIGLFIQVGGWLTLWPTLAIVLITGVLGTFLVRQQGLKVLAELRGSLRDMRDPVSPLAHGAMILFAGALLLTPGFFTDAVGFLLMVPALRRVLITALASRINVQGFATGAGPRQTQDGIIDADYEDVTEAAPETRPNDGPAATDANKKPSGWTEH